MNGKENGSSVTKKKRFCAENIRDLRYLSGVAISADGLKGAFVSNQGGEGECFASRIYVVDLKEETYAPLTDGKSNQKAPCFSADGKYLYYLSDESGEYQIYEWELASAAKEKEKGQDGEHAAYLQKSTGDGIRKLTSARHGVTRYQRSETGNRLVFELTLWEEEIRNGQTFTEMTPEEKAVWQKCLAMEPYYITELMYKQDAWFGMRHGEFPRIAALSLSDGVQSLIGNVSVEAERPAISRDGEKACWFGYPYDGTKGRTAELFLYDFAKGEERQLTENGAFYVDDSPVFTSDGNAVIGTAIVPVEGGMSMVPWQVTLSTGEGTPVFDPQDEGVTHGCHGMVTNHTAYGENTLSRVRGNGLYFLSSWHGRENIYRKEFETEKRVELAELADGDIQSFDIDAKGNLLYAMGTLNHPTELYYRKNGEEKRCLTSENTWLSDYELAETEEYWIPTKDGKDSLQCWLTHPAGQEEGKKYPAVLYVHGGPACTYNADFWHEAQALAGAGLAVIYTNPRGSAGYGSAFMADEVCWKQEAVDDLLAAVDSAVAKGFIDGEKIGVTGGSYGGYMTNKLIGTTKRFAAAVAQRSLINLTTSYGTGDMGFKSAERGQEGHTLLQYFMGRKKSSLIRNIDNIKIPLLILHGVKDYRCSFEQAEQLFVAMKDRNPEVPVRLVAFPEENHEVNRSGKIPNQIRHLSEMTDWFVKYLSEEGGKNE